MLALDIHPSLLPAAEMMTSIGIEFAGDEGRQTIVFGSTGCRKTRSVVLPLTIDVRPNEAIVFVQIE